MDEEVRSQIGTRMVAQLRGEKDISSSVRRLGRRRLILASLDSRQQTLLLGHAVPMPILIRTRDDGQALFDALKARSTGLPP